MRPAPEVWPGQSAEEAAAELKTELNRRLAIAMEAERNQAEAEQRAPRLDLAARKVRSELGLDDLPEVGLDDLPELV